MVQIENIYDIFSYMIHCDDDDDDDGGKIMIDHGWPFLIMDNT